MNNIILKKLSQLQVEDQNLHKVDSYNQKCVEIELQQSLETLRVQLTILLQVVAAIVGANVAYFGYSLQLGKALILGLGGIFPILLLLAINRGRKFMMPIIFSILVYEANIFNDSTGLGTTFLLYINGPDYVEKLLKISQISDTQIRYKELRSMYLPLGDKGIMRIGSLTAAILQFTLGLALYLMGIWPLI